MMTRRASTDNHVLDDAIHRVHKGNTAAFEIVVRQLERPLRAWLAVQAPPGVDVDEVAQRSFVTAFTRLSDYELGTNFTAWLFAIARFHLRTEVSRLRRVVDYHARYAPDLLQHELERRNSEPPELQETRLAHLQTCLGQLDKHLRCFIKWRYVEEIPLEEMAVRSGRSVAAVKKQLWKLRRKLHECVEARMTAEGEPS
ncbi:MAG: sigma-70 family RNA polymerase sigma factor [Phycisphaerales bacterium]|nr:MAG: sigma-70 family RNA polymerase sigma factor [Phycisphaerales bacterium]